MLILKVSSFPPLFFFTPPCLRVCVCVRGERGRREGGGEGIFKDGEEERIGKEKAVLRKIRSHGKKKKKG